MAGNLFMLLLDKEEKMDGSSTVKDLKLEVIAPPLGPVLHQLRHSGPSIDIALRVRDLGGVQKRGRWGAVESVRRY